MPGTVPQSTDGTDTLDSLWRAYHQLRDRLETAPSAAGEKTKTAGPARQLVQARNRLAEAYLPLVKACAIRLKGHLPRTVELDDLYHAGVFGLMEAIRKYDPAQEVLFTTYAPLRIRGAMFDQLRLTDRAPRLVRDRARKLNHAVTGFRQEHGRPPTRDELAEVLKVSPAELDRILSDGQVVGQVSLDRLLDGDTQDNSAGRSHQIQDPRADNPADTAQRRSLKELLCRMLSRPEQLIVVLYYYEGMTMKEIGQTLDLSESRVSQMHTSIKERLRAHLNGRAGELMTG
jgi:RNA polymerase sigma factor FliA